MAIKISDIAISDYRSVFPTFNMESQCVPFAEKIIKKYGEVQPAIPQDFSEIVKRVKAAIDKKETDTISRKDLRQVALFIFNPEVGEALAKNILNIIDERKLSGIFSALFTSYIISFDRKNPLCIKIASILSKNKENLSRKRKRQLEAIDFLDIKKIEHKIAEKMLKSGSIEDIITEIGLSGAFSGSNLITSSIMVMADKVRKEVESGQHKSWEKLRSMICEGDKVKPEYYPVALLGLLAPYVKAELPSAERKTALQTLILNSFGDPRIRLMPPWPTLQEEFGGEALRQKCIDLIKKWLISGTIDMFFKIIKATAPDHQFGPRHDLWRAYFKEEHITEACAVFGPEAKWKAMQMKRDDDSLEDLIFSSFSGSVQSDQSALLMRVGDLVIVEWSHNGKFRTWNKNNNSRPEFYQNQYYPASLRGRMSGSDDDGIAHLGGGWVNKIELDIRNKTGIRLRGG